jgi:DNA-binding SARP family transcriptional activator
MDFRILGPLEVLEGGRPVALGGSEQRALLALLLLHANETLSTDRCSYSAGEIMPSVEWRRWRL